MSSPAMDPEQFVNVNGIQLCYTDQGAGAVPVVFIHGFPFAKEMWKRQQNELSRDHRIITFDLRGFGKSGKGSDTISVDRFASDLTGLLDVLSVKKAIVCGISMGGYIAMNAAARVPERFAGLVLCDTQCIADSIEVKEKRYKTIRKIEAGGHKEFADEFVKTLFHGDTLSANEKVVDEVRTMIMSTHPDTITGTLQALAQRRETCTAMKSLNMPVLIITGREDSVIPLTQSELLSNTIKGSEMHVIEVAGHLPNLEQPEAFNRLVDSFARRIGQPSST